MGLCLVLYVEIHVSELVLGKRFRASILVSVCCFVKNQLGKSATAPQSKTIRTNLASSYKLLL